VLDVGLAHGVSDIAVRELDAGAAGLELLSSGGLEEPQPASAGQAADGGEEDRHGPAVAGPPTRV
jgi:hypothetical protein